MSKSTEYIGTADNVPVYRDGDFGNKYAFFHEWCEVKDCNTTGDNYDDTLEEFEQWCELYDITPHEG